MADAFSRRGLFAAAFGAEPPKVTVREGPNGTKVGLLGFGAMRLPTTDGGHANPWGVNASKAAIDQKAVNALVDYMLEHGVNYFDTSPAYCRGESERVLGAALARHPRGAYCVATKLSNFAESQFSAAASKRLFEDSLKFLKTDYVDFYLLHSVGNGGFGTFRRRFVDNGMIDWLVEQKRRGRIRNLGWSYHGDVKAVEWLLERHDAGAYHWDFAMIQMNYVDWRHGRETNARNQDAKYLYGELSRRGIPVVVMEPLLGGNLARTNAAVASVLSPLDPKATPANWAFRFAGTPPGVMTVLSGMTFREHVVENVATFSPLKPLSRDEQIAMERAAEAYLGIGAVPCTMCNYCMPCPYGLDIPAILAFRNRMCAEKVTDARTLKRAYAAAVPDPRRRADRCIGCRRCEPHCPQQIPISKTMDAIAAKMEEL